MERKDFIRKACAFCGCASLALFAGNTVKAAVNEDKPDDWRVPFMQSRFAELIGKMSLRIAEKDRIAVIEDVGRFCALENKGLDQFMGNVEGFLEKIKGSWVEYYVYDKEKNSIHIFGKPTETCGCPMVAKNNITAEFCNCSKGYMEAAMTKMTGKTAHATIDSSILTGSSKCSFTIVLT